MTTSSKRSDPDRAPHLTPDDRAARGKDARAKVPRSSHAGWQPHADRRDPVEILIEQGENREEDLVPIRYGRMLASPFTFYRGAAAIMSADLATTPASGLRVQACGDAHISNFGLFASPERSMLFDINDFDETLPGPWEWDVKRLAASIVIAARGNGFSTKEQRTVTMTAAASYREAMATFATQRNLDVWYARAQIQEGLPRLRAALEQSKKKVKKDDLAQAEAVIAKAKTRDSLQALHKLTHVVDGERRIVSQPPLVMPIEDMLAPELVDQVTEAIHTLVRSYRRTLLGDRRHLLEDFRFQHLAHKVVGVGSVGTRAWILLFLGRDDEDPLFLQAKEAQTSVLAPYAGKSTYQNQGQRVVEGQRLMQAASDIFLGWDRFTGLDGRTRDYYLRQLRDWKGSWAPESMDPQVMGLVGWACGWTLARAHARSGDRIAIASYLGSSDVFDRAIVAFAEAYADQNDRDHAALRQAATDGRIEAREGVWGRDTGPPASSGRAEGRIPLWAGNHKMDGMKAIADGRSRPSKRTRPSTEARYENRELSWLEFNARVLALADDPTVPLLERVRFIAIYSGNLDEFFQVRVAGLHEQLEAGAPAGPDGLPPAEALTAIQSRVRTLSTKRNRILTRSILPALAKEGIRIVGWEDLSKSDRLAMRHRFEEQIFPVLTPLAVDPAHPFPYVSDLSLNLAVVVRDPATRQRRFARVKVPQNLPRFIPVKEGARYIAIEQVVAAHVDRLFPGMEIIAKHPFRVTRDADMDVTMDEAEDLLSAIEESVRRRQRSLEAVRLEVDPTMPKSIVALLLEELDLTSRDVYVTKPMPGLGDLMEFTKIERHDLRYPPWPSVTQDRLIPVVRGTTSIFDVIREGDLLVQHPYDSFDTSVAAFLAQAASDPHVLAIKQTLYRTSVKDSPVIQALVRAASAGKQTVAMVELKARFDEQANIEWARILEEAGVHVVYGVVGLKTHAKLSMVVREEHGGLRRYCHVGTGNYHPGTATAYEDIGLLTVDPEIGADVSDLFNYITGYSRQDEYRAVLVAPLALRRELLAMIADEAMAGTDGRIVMKMNSLVDPQMIDALYAASAAGVNIDLIVRGACSLRAQIPGLSDNIRVRSLVGRFLEHSRVFRFGSDRRGARYFIGSADLMQRNLDHRVECLTPIRDPALAEHLQEILRLELEEDGLAWELGPKGWAKVPRTRGLNANDALMELARSRTHRVE